MTTGTIPFKIFDMAVGSCSAALLTLVVVPALSPGRSRDEEEQSDVAERLHSGPL